MPFGAEPLPGGGVRFRLWAPSLAQARLRIEAESGHTLHALTALPGGWHELILDSAGAGTRYRYQLDDGLAVPDPASRRNPDDVHGASEVVDPGSYVWHDAAWRGRPWHEAVVYELHVGTFTPAGTFAAAAERLADLVATGITAIELMPIAEFPGGRSWGYDGVLLFAPDASYGTPDELKAFVDRAHALGLMVLLDVVYNHFGPDGNYLHAYASAFFNPAHQTPWGAAINFDGDHSETVRSFFVHNALLWIDEYHFDGLRFDAVHAIRDDSEVHIVSELATALAAARRERHVHLVLENHANEADRLRPGGAALRADDGLADAQWNDDVHHAAHVLLTGETDSYYADYAAAPAAQFARALAEGFIFQGQPSGFMNGATRGQPSGHLPAIRFVSFVQNHDQIGNRAFGERLAALADPARLDALYACVLLAPQVPMLFMGEEFAASAPFLYFCDFHAELARAVRDGRRREFAHTAAFADPGSWERIPDPNARATFESSKLDWAERTLAPHAQRLALITRLLALRERLLVPLVPKQNGAGRWRADGDVVAIDWPFGGTTWRLRANLAAESLRIARPEGVDVYALRAGGDGASLLLDPNGVWVACDHAAA
jgi:maltooligosyltrehalose trehalohydrolase